jgi:hypothetical protein
MGARQAIAGFLNGLLSRDAAGTTAVGYLIGGTQEAETGRDRKDRKDGTH